MFIKPIPDPFEICEVLDGIGHVETFAVQVLENGEQLFGLDLNGFWDDPANEFELGSFVRKQIDKYVSGMPSDCIFAYDVTGADLDTLPEISGHYGMRLICLSIEADHMTPNAATNLVIAIPDRKQAALWKFEIHGNDKEFGRPDHWPKFD